MSNPDGNPSNMSISKLFVNPEFLYNCIAGWEFSIKHVNGKTFHLQHKDGTIIKDCVSKTIQKLGLKNGNGKFGSFTIIFKVIKN